MLPFLFRRRLVADRREVDSNNVPLVDGAVWSLADNRLECRGPGTLSSTMGLLFAHGGPGVVDTCMRLLRVLLAVPVGAVGSVLDNTAGGVGVPGRKRGCCAGFTSGSLGTVVVAVLRARTPEHAVHSFLQLSLTYLWISSKPASRSSWSYLAFSVSICFSL